MITPVMFTENQCGRVLINLFGPEMYDFAGYQVQLTVIYTNGKDIGWSEFPSSENTKGVMTGAFLIPKSRIAAGGALIDIKECATSASIGKVSLQVGIGGGQSSFHTRTASLAQVRFEVISALAHEIFHMIQAWRAGDTYDGKEVISPSSLRYTQTFKRLMDEIARTNPKRSTAFVRGAAHAGHPSEREAEQFSRGRVERFRKLIEAGHWDECLPIDALKKYCH